MVAVSIQARRLTRKDSEEDLALFRAAHEWDLVDPIIIESSADLKSEASWRERLEPFQHQVENLITFCRRLPVTLLADDVGLGKTISSGLIISELIARERLQNILIVCPKLLGPQWKEELQSKFGVEAHVVTGKELVMTVPENKGAVITTYQTARMYLDDLPEDRFQMLILDEAHKLRNLYGTASPPKVALQFRKALEQRRFAFVLMLTATPLQNRLWDLYSLVDLLAVARGHENPFGSEGIFARKFIGDGRETARVLRSETTDEFRSIVYSYMSRVRRSDAKLYFPEREVQMHRVSPSPGELLLIDLIGAQISKLQPLAQISVLQALCSSPDAVAAQLRNMKRNETIPPGLSESVDNVVKQLPLTAKLRGLISLIESLRKEKPDHWRVVVFTTRRETQTTIQDYLEKLGVKVGLINGSTNTTNHEMIAGFRKSPPDVNVIVSTEAGSEGVNLQAANVLVNFDLPWNPMIVEQRIGRVQRLASQHAKVAIFNITLAGTFEEQIVGRLMEKLSLAAHAIGDIESLLEASGVGDGDSGDGQFEEQIRKLVVASLTGKDVSRDMALREASIESAKRTLAEEEEQINSLLGQSHGAEYKGPKSPRLPDVVRTMSPVDFVATAVRAGGGVFQETGSGQYEWLESGRRERLHFDEKTNSDQNSTLVTPSSPIFKRFVSKYSSGGMHSLSVPLHDSEGVAKDQACKWAGLFASQINEITLRSSVSCFEGTALLRARVTVGHDSYERLVEVQCHPDNHQVSSNPSDPLRVPGSLDNVSVMGVRLDALTDAVQKEPGIDEFTRFYLDRREYEVAAAGSDERKRRKLEDEFTPRISAELLSLRGRVFRKYLARVNYSVGDLSSYESDLVLEPHSGLVVQSPEMSTCEETQRQCPVTCLGKCDVTGKSVLRHLLVKSEASERRGLPSHIVNCEVSGLRVLSDETILSDVSGKPVLVKLIQVSSLSGRKAEPVHFARCEFSDVNVLQDELQYSQVSGRRFRNDQVCRSSFSGIIGHQSEFINCRVTGDSILPLEAEICDESKFQVRPGVLEQCAVTKKRVIPSLLVATTKGTYKVLKSLLVKSSVSGARILKQSALRSKAGKYCSQNEAITCVWLSRSSHPEDVGTCEITGSRIHQDCLTTHPTIALMDLVDQLRGIKLGADGTDKWADIAAGLSRLLSGRVKIVSAVQSPDRKTLACCAEIKTLLGLKVRYAGFLYSLTEAQFLGRISVGRRQGTEWTSTESE